jgi:hypothetical protein
MGDYHARFSPSGAHRWIECPGSMTFPPDPDDYNEYSDEGTCAHAVAALAYKSGKPVSDWVGTPIEVGDFRTYTFRDDMVEPTQRYVDFIATRIPDYEAVWAEDAVPIDMLTNEEGATGTCDHAGLTKDGLELHVDDLKFGHRPVSARDNEQLLMYAAGVYFGRLTEPRRAKLERIVLRIHQPRIRQAPDEWVTTPDEMLRIRSVCQAAVAAASVPSPRFNPGPEQCQYCPGKGSCEAQTAAVQAAIGEPLPDADAVTLGRLGRLLPMVEEWIKAVRSKLEATILSGKSVPGWKLVQGKAGNRKWSDNAAAEAALKKLRLKKDVMYDLKLITPTEAERRLEKRQYAKLEPLIVRAEGGLSVAPEEDSRPAVPNRVTPDMLDDAPAATPATLEDIL